MELQLSDISNRDTQALEVLQNIDDLSQDRSADRVPRVDGGKDAWLFLAASFVIEGLIWGFAFAFGIFQDYYSSHEPFKSSGNIAVIGTSALGVTYLLAPVHVSVLHAFPHFRRWATPIGFLIICLSVSLSSFSSNTTQLILSQGVGYGLGAGLAYTPSVLFMNEWFVRRRGFAFGIMWAGTGTSGIITPLALQWLLDSYGVETTLRVWALIIVTLVLPVIYFSKPRLSSAQYERSRHWDISFLWNRTFLFFQVGNVVEGLGYFLPTLYLPTYAQSLGATTFMSSLTVILFNLASVFGCVLMGSLVDRYHATTCILISTIGSALSVFLLWGLSSSLVPLYFFCMIYGLFAGSFSATWPAVASEVMKTKRRADPGLIYGFLAAGRGIGNVISGPLSEALLKVYSGYRGGAVSGYGGQYGILIIFTGVTALLGGFSFLMRPMRLV